MSQGQLVLSWPGRLSIYDLNRLLRAKRTCKIPDELGRLAEKGVQLESADAYALIEQIENLADTLGFYPLDASKNPEEWEGREADLPTCVLATSNDMFVNVNDMQRILHLYDGTNIPDYVPQGERMARRERQRRRLVLTTECREKDCHEPIHVTVAMAARAIREHHLVEKGDSYEPPTLCKRHRLDRDVHLAEKRRNGALSAPIGEHKSVRDALAAAPKPEKPKKDKDKNKDTGGRGRGRSRRDKPAEPEVKPEVCCADQDAAFAPGAVTEPETPQAANPEPEPEQQPAA